MPYNKVAKNQSQQKMEMLITTAKQDPQSNLSISINDRLLEATFLLWDSNDQDIRTHNGKLIFYNCWAAEYVNVEIFDAAIREPCHPNIFLSKIIESQWYDSKIQQRAEIYPTWLAWDKKKHVHYLLEGRDHHIQMIASAFEFQIISCVL